jgi:hypothetical protein
LFRTVFLEEAVYEEEHAFQKRVVIEPDCQQMCAVYLNGVVRQNKKEKKRVRIMTDKGRRYEGREVRKKQQGRNEENIRGK